MPPKKRNDKPSEPSSDEDGAQERGDVAGDPTPVTSEAPPVATSQETTPASPITGDDAGNEPILGAAT